MNSASLSSKRPRKKIFEQYKQHSGNYSVPNIICQTLFFLSINFEVIPLTEYNSVISVVSMCASLVLINLV